jgi:hypothetical protein
MTDTTADAPPAMGLFERYLTLWVALCIVAGIALGQVFPAPFRLLGNATIAEVNMPVAILVWLMIVPMLLKIDLGALGQVREHWRGIMATVGVNWLVKPPADGLRCTVKLRARDSQHPALVRISGGSVPGSAEVLLDEPALPAPGQACVFYDGDRLLGGGFIRSSEVG